MRSSGNVEMSTLGFNGFRTIHEDILCIGNHKMLEFFNHASTFLVDVPFKIGLRAIAGKLICVDLNPGLLVFCFSAVPFSFFFF